MEKLFLRKATQPINSIFSDTCKWLLMAFAACCSLAATAQSTFQPFEATYVAYRYGDDVGHASMSLQKQQDDLYRLEYYSKVSKFFLSDKRQEVSVFKLENRTPVPIKYDYTRTGTGPDKKLSVEFNAVDNTVLIDGKPQYDWHGETDNQLYRLDLSARLADGESEFDYQFINSRGEQRQYHIVVLDKEQLELPFGMLEGIKVKIQRETNKRETFAWFAPSLNYVLVQLQQLKEGEEQGQIRLQQYRSLVPKNAQ